MAVSIFMPLKILDTKKPAQSRGRQLENSMVDYGRFLLSGLGRLLFEGGRFSLRSFVMTFAGSFGGGRLSWSLRCANAPAETSPSIASTTNCLTNFTIRLSLLMPFCGAHGREKEMRRHERQQDKCHRSNCFAGAFLR
jgi:hypothetical protein